jgi:hypothetical protein
MIESGGERWTLGDNGLGNIKWLFSGWCSQRRFYFLSVGIRYTANCSNAISRETSFHFF